jgi:hypothetical protein
MAVELNINPYYDDFDEFKNFHQLLFKPGYAVQARELTQLQSIIQDQIKKFGTHIFQQGSVVIPGNSFPDLYTPYIKMQTLYNTLAVDGRNFTGKVVVGDTSNVRAIVRAFEPATPSDPLTFYLTYLSGGGNNGEYSTFLPNEELYVETDSTIRATVALIPTPGGYGSLAFIKTGVFFVNGRFVTIQDSQVVISKYDSLPSCRVLLKITEEIVTSNEDDSLLDPASGSYNFAAPGADRLKVSLELTKLPLSQEIDDNYVEIMRFNNGVLEEHSRYPKYSELEKSLARRTYDESGDYIVNGFRMSLAEHLKTTYNDGVFTEDNGGDRDKFVYKVAPGKAYIKGFEVEKIAETRLVADKARTLDHVKYKEHFIQPLYGQHIFVTNLVKLPNFRQREKVELWSASTGGSKIGEMYVYAIDLLEGDASQQNAVYNLFFHDVAMVGTNKLKDVGRIVFGTGGSAKVLIKYNVINLTKDFFDAEDSPQDTINNAANTRAAKVHRFVRSESTLYVFRHDSTKEIPLEGDYILGSGVNNATATIKTVSATVQQGASNPLLPVRVDSLKSIKNQSSTYANLEYFAWATVTINTDSNGDGTASISNATFVQPEVGTIVAASASGNVSPSKFSLVSSTILQLDAGPASETVNILIQIKKTALAPKNKVLNTLTLNNVVPSNSISLTVCDVYEVTSVFDASGNDVSRNYVLDNGQRDYYYGIGKLNLVGSLPDSNLTIQLKYFSHVGSGDFFCVDSYTTLGSEYISKVPSYVSTNTSQVYDLRGYLDFRPRVDQSTGLFSGSASLSDFPVLESILTTPVQYYVPRIDSVVLSKNGALTVVSGEPAAAPKKPIIPSDSIELYAAFVPAYTSLAKNVVTKMTSTKRYTMSDISGLENRISSIERLSILNSNENSVVRTDVVDPITGLNRFKSGYLVDNFTNPFAIADTTLIANTSSFYGQKFGPRKEGFASLFNIYTTANGSTNYQNTNGQFTLPYTEAAFINQNTSTKANTLNPFSSISWEGVLKIGPNFDLSVQNTNTTTVNTTATVNIPQEPEQISQVTDPVVWPEVIPTPPVVDIEPIVQPVVIPPEPVVVIPEPEIRNPALEAIVYITPGGNPLLNRSSDYATEGDSIIFSFYVNNGLFNADGTRVNSKTYYWYINGTNITAGDFSDGLGLSGSFVVNSNNFSTSITKTLAADLSTEGLETFDIFLTDVSNETPGYGYSLARVWVVDTTPVSPQLYTITPNVFTVNEGDSVTWSITTQNISNGTVLYWDLDLNSSDISSPLSGTVTINSNAASVTTTILADLLTEGEENLRFNLRTTSPSGTVVAAQLVTILDTSTTLPPEPEYVTVGVLASNLGISGTNYTDNTVIQVEVTKADYDAFNNTLSGRVIDANVDVQAWADAYAFGLMAPGNIQEGSEQWVSSVNNAVSYLTSLGYADESKYPKSTWPGGKIYTILDNAYNTAKSALGR